MPSNSAASFQNWTNNLVNEVYCKAKSCAPRHTTLGNALLMAWFAVTVLHSHAVADDCNDSSRRVVAQLEFIKPPLDSGKLFNLAAMYVDAKCFDKALTELTKADVALAKERLNPHATESGVRKNTHAGLFEFIAAMDHVNAGRPAIARKQLLKLLSENRSTDILWRTTMALGRLFTLDVDEEAWKEFEPYLTQLSSKGGWFWQVDFFRMHYEARTGRGTAAIRRVSAALGTELPTQRRLALQILLGELLLADGRTANTQVLCANFEEEMGEALIELELRLRYLQLCADASRKEAALSPDSRIQRKLRIYDSAIAKYKKEM